jgi:hypothetical protein
MNATMQAEASARDKRKRRRRPGRISMNGTASRRQAPSQVQRFGLGISMFTGSTGMLVAELDEEGGSVETVKVAGTEELLCRVAELGLTVHVAPIKSDGIEQARATVLLDALSGAMVSAAVPDCPARMMSGSGLATTEKSGIITLRKIETELRW